MREFCQTYNLTLEKYFEALADTQKDIDKIVKLFFIGYKAACLTNKEEIVYTEIDVCDWIDEIGSIYISEGQVVEYFKYILSTINVDVTDVKDTEKKKALKR